MIIEDNKDLKLIKRLCSWLDEKGMTPEYFFEMLKEVGFVFPLKINDFAEDDEGNFSFLCSSANYEINHVSYRIILNLNKSTPRMITFANIHGFWKQPMEV